MNDATNQDVSDLKRMLEAATATDATSAGGECAPPAINDEFASLREAWLAFGQLVRAADDSLPAMQEFVPPAAVAIPAGREVQVVSGIPGYRLKTGRAVPSPRQRLWFGMTLAVAVAAATLLMAVALGRWGRLDRTLKPTPVTADSRPSRLDPSLPHNSAATAKTSVSHTRKVAITGPSLPATWDDSLDTQIAQVSQQITEVKQNWQHRVDDVDVVQYRMDEVSDALQSDQL